MSHRRKESDATDRNVPDELFNIFTCLHLRTRLSFVKFQQFWYFTDRPAKMALAKRFMRTKQILILITSFLFVFGTMWFGNHPDVRPKIRQEHRAIFVLPTVPTKPFPDHTSLIRRLGLIEDFHSSNQSIEDDNIEMFQHLPWVLDLPQYANRNGPAIVTAIFKRSDYESILKLISTVQLYASDSHLAIFDLIPPDKKENNKQRRLDAENFQNNDTVDLYCNITEVCSINYAPLLEEWVPSYIRKKDLGAYKAILVQKMLKEFPRVLWIDSNALIPPTGLEGVWNNTRSKGITTWQLTNRCVISCYTFPKMKPYFGLVEEDLHYDSMIESGSYAFSQTPPVFHLLMKWLNCSLTEHCIKPIGCGSSDCQIKPCTNHQPNFGYLGCHKYETSALSASLVKLNFHNTVPDNTPYILSQSAQVSAAEQGYNMTSIRITINREKTRLFRITNRRKVNRLSDLVN